MTDDLIGRAEAQTAIQFAAKRYTVAHEAHGEGQVVWSDNLINVTDAMNVLRDLPSVQPEMNCSEIPNNSDTISRQLLGTNLAEVGTDCISRQQVIEPEAISRWKNEFKEYVDLLNIPRDDWKGIIEYIDELPSAEPDTTTHDSIPVKNGRNDEDRTNDDCISRQQAIEVLRNRWLKTRNYEGIGEDVAEECEIYLKTLPSVQPETNCSEIPNNWIPCSERLPKDDTEVLVYLFENNKSPYIAWLSDGRWYTEYFEVEREDEPVAWMPLPEPYKGEQK